MSKSILTALLAALLATGSASAVAAADQDSGSATVRYGDLNLASQDGAKIMLARISSAARRVCDEAALPGDASGWRSEWRQCIDARIRNAVKSLDAPMVTAAYGGKPQVILADAR